MSDAEISNSEASSFKEDSKLVSKSEKQKHASATEKDDANLLSEGSSQEDDEEELVLEYSGKINQYTNFLIRNCL